MHNLSNYSKGQFFVLTAFAIVAILYFISKWLQPSTIIDTSSPAASLDTFVFNNIVEKANETVEVSESCEDLKFNLEEYKNFVENLYGKRFIIDFNYTLSCTNNKATVNFNITQSSIKTKIHSEFSVTKKF